MMEHPIQNLIVWCFSDSLLHLSPVQTHFSTSLPLRIYAAAQQAEQGSQAQSNCTLRTFQLPYHISLTKCASLNLLCWIFPINIKPERMHSSRLSTANLQDLSPHCTKPDSVPLNAQRCSNACVSQFHMESEASKGYLWISRASGFRF